MNNIFKIIPFVLISLCLMIGCASTTVTDRQQLVNEKLPRPDRILVSDFAATPADVPADSTIAGRYDEHPAPQTAEQIAAGRQVGAEIASQLVEQISGMGLPAERAPTGTTAKINDILIRGYLLSIDKGSAMERVGIGLGSGTSELKVVVEGYQMTAQGLRKLGSGTVDADGSKTPGVGVGLASLLVTDNPVGLIVTGGMKVYGEKSGKSKIEGRAKQATKEIADQLKLKFEHEGWIE